MRVPIRHIVDHLVWSTTGTVWAIWKVEPQGSPYMERRQREDLLSRVTTMVRSLPGAARVFGLCAQLDPGEVVSRTLKGVDLDRHPHWAQVAHAQLDLLAEMEMHQRTVWLAVPLAASGARAELSAALGSTWAELSGLLGLAPAPVPAREVAAYRQWAQQVAAELGSGLEMRPARPAEIVWMVQHAVHRGLEEPLLVHAADSSSWGGRVVNGVLRSPSYADLGQVRLLEGGQGRSGEQRTERRTGTLRRGRTAPSPVKRVWLQVESQAGIGYQAHLALAEMPAAAPAEAADVLAQLELLPYPVDFVCDLRLVPAEKVKQEVRRKKRELMDQAEQYDAQSSIGLPEEMYDAAGDLGELDARVSRSSVEVEVQAVTVLTVWGGDARTCDERARSLAKQMSGADYRLVRPIGTQQHLFALGLPGAATPAPVREFTQYQLSEDWAMTGAFYGGQFGDPSGQMIGVGLDCGTVRPVLLDIANAPKETASASFGVAGELGAGKSVLLKLITSAVVDRGGRAIVIDRTPIREWATFAAAAAPGRCQVVDAAAAELSIDPLRIFPVATGAHYALSYLTLQLGVGPMTAQGAVVKRAVAQAAACPEPSMSQVLRALEEMARQETGPRAQDAATVCDLLRVVCDDPLAAMVFDPALPPISLTDLNSDLVVITTTGLTLPPREAVTHPELLRQQPVEALIGRAVLYLVAALSRQIAFAQPEQFTLITVDECYWLTSSTEGLALVHEVVHDGRKHGAGIGLGGHDVLELGNETIRGLLAYRFLARTGDEVLARRGLEFLGLTPDEELVRLVTSELSPIGVADRAGEMLGRDPRMQIGRFQVLVPALARLESGIFTTPGEGAPPAPNPAQESAAGEVRAEGTDSALAGAR